ncbi:hypothetical protein [Kribbella sp. NPDC051620]|uniref:hypothetical protein n=1 Tax=Kribbella sp. NPDC051620 TaxID=3364120 RepID=UPI0037A04400
MLLDPATFRPDNAVVAHTALSVKALRVLQGAGFALPPTLANNAGASHRPIRAAVARFFSPARVAAIEPLTRRLVSERVEAALVALESGPVDLVEAVAAEPPALVLLHLLGLNDVDVPELKAWSRESLELFWGWPDEDRQLELAHSAAEFYGWLRQRVIDARRVPGDDLFGVLVALGLSDEEICAVAYFLLIAGQETTTQLISTAFHRILTAAAPPAAGREEEEEERVGRPAAEGRARVVVSTPVVGRLMRLLLLSWCCGRRLRCLPGGGLRLGLPALVGLSCLPGRPCCWGCRGMVGRRIWRSGLGFIGVWGPGWLGWRLGLRWNVPRRCWP